MGDGSTSIGVRECKKGYLTLDRGAVDVVSIAWQYAVSPNRFMIRFGSLDPSFVCKKEADFDCTTDTRKMYTIDARIESCLEPLKDRSQS